MVKMQSLVRIWEDRWVLHNLLDNLFDWWGVTQSLDAGFKLRTVKIELNTILPYNAFIYL